MRHPASRHCRQLWRDLFCVRHLRARKWVSLWWWGSVDFLPQDSRQINFFFHLISLSPSASPSASPSLLTHSVWGTVSPFLFSSPSVCFSVSHVLAINFLLVISFVLFISSLLLMLYSLLFTLSASVFIQTVCLAPSYCFHLCLSLAFLSLSLSDSLFAFTFFLFPLFLISLLLSVLKSLFLYI